MSETKTTWTKTAKEGFVEHMETTPPKKCDKDSSGNPHALISGAVANFGENDYVGKDLNEMILTSDTTKPLPTLSPEEMADLKNEPSMWELFSKAKDNPPTLAEAKNYYKKLISILRHGIDNTQNNIAGFIGRLIYDGLESPDAQKDMKILSSQIAKWLSIIMTYILLLNWWYIYTSTNFVFKFSDYGIPPLKWIVDPVMQAFEFVHYNTLTFRMTSSNYTDSYRMLWHWRSVVFSLIHLIIFFCIYFAPVTKLIESMMCADGILFFFILGLSYYYWFKIIATDDKSFFTNMGGITGLLLLTAFVIGSFLGVLVMVAIAFPFFTMYYLIMSFWGIFIFNWFWPPSVISCYYRIFEELKGTEAGINEETTTSQKMYNLVISHFHSIYFSFFLLACLTLNIYQTMMFSSDPLIVIGIIINVILFLLLAPSEIRKLPFVRFDKFFGGFAGKDPVVSEGGA